jgi:topoisomerase-4 subunit A
MKEVGPRGVSSEDVERLLKIPIRRISLYDINKARTEMDEIKARIKQIGLHLKNIVDYAVSYLDGIIAKVKANEEIGKGARKTKVGKFEKIDVKEVVKKDLELKYDKATGYLGTAVAGNVAAELSPFDRILVLKQNASYSVIDIPDKVFAGANAWWIGEADKDVLSKTVFTIIYKDKETGFPCIKRCVIEGWIMNREYNLVPEGCDVLHVDTRQKFSFTVHYVPKPRLKITKEVFKVEDFLVKGLKAGGVRIANKEVKKIEIK